MKSIFTLLLCLLMIGPMSQDEKATLVFYRPKKMSMAGMEFSFGNLKTGTPLVEKLKNGRYLEKAVMAGEAIDMQGLRQKEIVSFVPEAGKIYYVKVEAGNMSNYNIELTDESEAKPIIAKLKKS